MLNVVTGWGTCAVPPLFDHAASSCRPSDAPPVLQLRHTTTFDHPHASQRRPSLRRPQLQQATDPTTIPAPQLPSADEPSQIQRQHLREGLGQLLDGV